MMLHKNVTKVSGLCGNFDDDDSNDIPPTQTTYNVSDSEVHEPEKEYDFVHE